MIKALIKRSNRATHNAFIAPWKDRARAKVLLAGVLGSFFHTIQGFTLTFTMGGESISENLTFQIVRYSLIGLVGIPFTAWAFARGMKGWMLALIQLAGTALYFIDPSSGIINALASVVTMSSFWFFYTHQYSLSHSSANRGSEASLALYLLTVASSLGLLLGGLMLQEKLYELALLIGSIGGIGATMLILSSPAKEALWPQIWRLIGKSKPSTRLTLLMGCFGACIDICLALWMRLIGLSPLSTGLNMSLRLILGMLLVPLVGALVNKGSMPSNRIGGLMMFCGCVLLWFSKDNTDLILPALVFVAISSNFLFPAEYARWLKRRSVPGVLAREFLLAFGRAVGFAFVIPIIFAAPAFYPVICLGISLLILWIVKPSRKGFGKLPQPTI